LTYGQSAFYACSGRWDEQIQILLYDETGAEVATEGIKRLSFSRLARFASYELMLDGVSQTQKTGNSGVLAANLKPSKHHLQLRRLP